MFQICQLTIAFAQAYDLCWIVSALWAFGFAVKFYVDRIIDYLLMPKSQAGFEYLEGPKDRNMPAQVAGLADSANNYINDNELPGLTLVTFRPGTFFLTQFIIYSEPASSLAI